MLQKICPPRGEASNQGERPATILRNHFHFSNNWILSVFHSTDFSVTINRSSNYDIVNRNQSTVSTTTTQNDLNVPFL